MISQDYDRQILELYAEIHELRTKSNQRFLQLGMYLAPLLGIAALALVLASLRSPGLTPAAEPAPPLRQKLHWQLIPPPRDSLSKVVMNASKRQPPPRQTSRIARASKPKPKP